MSPTSGYTERPSAKSRSISFARRSPLCGRFPRACFPATRKAGAKWAEIRTNGSSWGDVDNDGDLDLYVTSMEHPQHFLFINDGQGGFAEEAVLRGADIPDVNGYARYGYSATFGDYDKDGFIDLFATEWRLSDQSGNNQFARHNTRLLRNQGAGNPGYFEDVTEAAGVSTELIPSSGEELTNSEGFAPRFSDIDRDGYPDLLLAADHNASRLFWNNGDGTFTDGTVEANVGTDHNGMGSALGDYDNDGDMDWFVTSIYQEGSSVPGSPLLERDGNRLFQYDGDRVFSDVTDEAGVRDGAWGWVAAFLDYDNDGDLDLAMTNGMDYPLASFDAGFEDDQSVFWENDGSGKFVNVSDSVGITDTLSGKGLLTFDYDKDGDLDIFIVNNREGPILYRNDGGNEANWIRAQLSATNDNTSALGAFVTVVADDGKPSEIMIREVNAGSHFLAQSETALHFGLGDRDKVDEIRIEWPNGHTTRHFDLEANTAYAFVQPEEPEISSRLSYGGAMGLGFEHQITSSLAAVSYEADGLPVGLVIDQSSGLIAGVPAAYGRFIVDLRALHPQSESEAVLELVVTADYNFWAGLHFQGPGENDLLVSGPDADFDSDGRSNFREYAEQTNPRTLDYGSSVSVSAKFLDTRLFPTLTYQEFPYATDLISIIEESTDLLDWNDASNAFIEDVKLDSPGRTQSVTARRLSPIDNSDSYFLRIRSIKAQ